MSPALPTTADSARARAVTGTARTLSGVLAFLGLLGILNTGLGDLGGDSALGLFVFLVHPVTALLWFAIGLVGIAMAVRPDRAQLFLVGAGALLVAWALLALALGDDVSQVLTRDPQVVALHLIGGVVALAVALAPLPASLVRVLVPPADGPGPSS